MTKRPYTKRLATNRSSQYKDGQRNGVTWAITWLHRRAEKMNDPQARLILNSAAFNMGQEAQTATADDSN